MFHRLVRELADMHTGPTFQKVTSKPDPEDTKVKPAMEHEKDAQQSEGNTKGGGDADKSGRSHVRLGIVPDFTGGDEPGAVAETVLEGGAAKAAGMQDGDRIVRIGDRTIKDIYGYIGALKGFKPGDKLDVVVVRKGVEITLKVELKAAPRPRPQPE